MASEMIWERETSEALAERMKEPSCVQVPACFCSWSQMYAR